MTEVHSSVSFTLPTNIETLFLTGNAIYGIGNSGNNAVVGNDVANVLEAGKAARVHEWARRRRPPDRRSRPR